MSDYEFCVITALPEDPRMNLAIAMDLYRVAGPPTKASGYMNIVEPMDLATTLGIQAPVFLLGEILILAGGREVAGVQRKPSKWGCDYDLFDSLDEAVARAKMVQEEASV